MEEYCRYYGDQEEIDCKTHSILLQLSNLPVSPARMMTLMTFYRYESRTNDLSLIIESWNECGIHIKVIAFGHFSIDFV